MVKVPPWLLCLGFCASLLLQLGGTLTMSACPPSRAAGRRRLRAAPPGYGSGSGSGSVGVGLGLGLGSRIQLELGLG